ncbi:LysE family translocator [Glaciecola sp. 1036]|uniref:LysE family translocator n=1 Tax=Alteromonadaceae TaxID=72275 RepID=UPI003D015D2D
MGLDLGVWLTIAVMHAVAVASPGPDFAVVLKQSLQQGRKLAIWTSIGVGVGILVHVAYSLLGIGLLIKANQWIYNVLLYLAAAYLIYIGISGLRSASSVDNPEDLNNVKVQTTQQAFWIGFITNGLNPKATLFFLALFSLAIPLETSLTAKIIYGCYLAFATGCWFIFISFMTSHHKIRSLYQQKGYWFDRAMGIVLICMAILLVVNN